MDQTFEIRHNHFFYSSIPHHKRDGQGERERERRTEMTFLEYMLIPFIMEASIKSLESFRFSIELLYATVSKNRNRLSSRTDMNSTRSQMNQTKQSSLLLKVQLVRLVMLVKIKVKKVGLNFFFFLNTLPQIPTKVHEALPPGYTVE